MNQSLDPFEYTGYELLPEHNQLVCLYRIGDDDFREEFTFPSGGAWESEAVREAARLLYLLAGVSYYKTQAPQVIDLGDIPVSEQERAFLRSFYIEGLGEFAYRLREHNPERFPDGLDLTSLRITGGRPHPGGGAQRPDRPGMRPLIPFGGGLDSIVSVAMMRHVVDDPALFIVSRPGDLFEAIEAPAAQTGLKIVRAERSIDPKLLGSKAHGYLNGHVPVTGIISATGVLAAALLGFDAVVMSNEWSASSSTLELDDGRRVNHQYSKSGEFERAFAQCLNHLGLPDYFSLLRPFSELWIARYFAENCRDYLTTFRSCNRSFTMDKAKRLDHWCGVCDKCAFIDLILSPFVPTDSLTEVFRGVEPLQNPVLEPVFERLMGLGSDPKPWECVGDVSESRVAIRLASAGRVEPGPLVQKLAERAAPFGDPEADVFLLPLGEIDIPERYGRVLDLV